VSGVARTLVAGGPIVGVLIVLSLLSIGVIAARVIALRRVLSGGALRDRAVGEWAAGARDAAVAAVAAGDAPADRLLHRAMEGLRAGMPRPVLTADLEWRGNDEVARMGRGVRLLELIAMVSPLLGLLGTVLGMIQSFQELALAEGAANASVLAAGIWTALLTTAAGLIVAIPAAVAAGLLQARIDAAGQAIEASVGRLMDAEDRARHAA
jgi:biopolymer transport protein ExbB